MNVKIFANYGVLAHEKETVYTANCEHMHAVTSDTVEVILPDELMPVCNVYGEIIVTVPGMHKQLHARRAAGL